MKNSYTAGLIAHAPKSLLTLAGLVFAASSLAQVGLPASIQAESYNYMSGVQTETTSDVGGGLDVGWIDSGDWMAYSNQVVSIPSSGSYDVQYRIASAGGGGSIRLEESGGATNYGTISVPSTGGWQTWATITQRVTLSAGNHSFGLVAVTGGFNINWFKISSVQSAGLPAIKQSGQYWVDANGTRMNLRGTNIGNWLIQEFWMMGGSMTGINDQCGLESKLSQRFGTAEKERLMKVFRDSFITTRDFDLMKGLGMNVVRIPFLYTRPTPCAQMHGNIWIGRSTKPKSAACT
jgi:endoglucanase